MTVLPNILTALAAAAVTLSGFAAVFRAFGGTQDPDGYSKVRLNAVIEGGLLIAVLCFLPAVLLAFHIQADWVWRICSGPILVWTYLRIVIPTSNVLRAKGPLPELFILVTLNGLTAFASLLLNVLIIVPIEPYSLYLLGMVTLFANLCLVFVAQFRAERPD